MSGAVPAWFAWILGRSDMAACGKATPSLLLPLPEGKARGEGEQAADFGLRISGFFRASAFGFRIFAIALCCAGCSTTPQSHSNSNLLPPLRPYVQEVANELGMVSPERRVVLDELAANVVALLKAVKP